MRPQPSICTAFSAWLIILTAELAHGIKVKFGTNDGPIVPPPPSTTVKPVPPFREPAPVWEEQRDDLPDPNITWRPLFVPNPLYTRVNYKPLQPISTPTPQTSTQNVPTSSATTSAATPVQNAPGPQSPTPSQVPFPNPTQIPSQTSTQTVEPPLHVIPLSNARRFVNAYVPSQPTSSPRPQQYFQPAQPTSSKYYSAQNVPGGGLRYFMPSYQQQLNHHKTQEQRYDDSRENHLDNNEIDDSSASAHDAHLFYEKESTRRARRTMEGSNSQNIYYYQWPVYNSYRQQY